MVSVGREFRRELAGSSLWSLLRWQSRRQLGPGAAAISWLDAGWRTDF